MDQLGALFPILLVAGAFYLLILRPSRQRQSAARTTASKLAPGARIMTTAGMFGRVVRVEGSEVDIEIAPGVTVRYVSAAIAQVIDEPAPDPSLEGAPQGTTGDSQASSGEDDTPQA